MSGLTISSAGKASSPLQNHQGYQQQKCPSSVDNGTLPPITEAASSNDAGNGLPRRVSYLDPVQIKMPGTTVHMSVPGSILKGSSARTFLAEHLRHAGNVRMPHGACPESDGSALANGFEWPSDNDSLIFSQNGPDAGPIQQTDAAQAPTALNDIRIRRELTAVLDTLRAHQPKTELLERARQAALTATSFYSQADIVRSGAMRSECTREVLASLGFHCDEIGRVLEAAGSAGADEVINACRVLSLKAGEAYSDKTSAVRDALAKYIKSAKGDYSGTGTSFLGSASSSLNGLEKKLATLMGAIGHDAIRSEILSDLTPALLHQMEIKGWDISEESFIRASNSQAMHAGLELMAGRGKIPLKTMESLAQLLCEAPGRARDTQRSPEPCPPTSPALTASPVASPPAANAPGSPLTVQVNVTPHMLNTQHIKGLRGTGAGGVVVRGKSTSVSSPDSDFPRSSYSETRMIPDGTGKSGSLIINVSPNMRNVQTFEMAPDGQERDDAAVTSVSRIPAALEEVATGSGNVPHERSKTSASRIPLRVTPQRVTLEDDTLQQQPVEDTPVIEVPDSHVAMPVADPTPAYVTPPPNAGSGSPKPPQRLESFLKKLNPGMVQPQGLNGTGRYLNHLAPRHNVPMTDAQKKGALRAAEKILKPEQLIALSSHPVVQPVSATEGSTAAHWHSGTPEAPEVPQISHRGPGAVPGKLAINPNVVRPRSEAG